jgi:multiple sugar transport system substrate-binding protein
MWFEAGNRLTDEAGTSATFDTELSVAAFTYIKDIYTNEKYTPMLPPGVSGWDDFGNNNAWFAGTIGFTSNAGTLEAQSLKQYPDIGNDTLLVPQPAMPIGAKQTLVQPADGAVFYIPQNAKNADAAKALIQLMLAPDQQQRLWQFTQTYVTPAYAWGWDTDQVKQSPNNIDLTFKKYAFAPNTFSWFQPAPEPLLWVQGVRDAVVFTDTMAAIMNGTSIKDAVAQGQQKIESIGKQFNWT